MDSIEFKLSLDYFDERNLDTDSDEDLSTLLYGIQTVLFISIPEILIWFVDEWRLYNFDISVLDVREWSSVCAVEFMEYLCRDDWCDDIMTEEILDTYGVLVDDVIQGIVLLTQREYDSIVSMMDDYICRIFHIVLSKIDLIPVTDINLGGVSFNASYVLLCIVFKLRSSGGVKCLEV